MKLDFRQKIHTDSTRLTLKFTKRSSWHSTSSSAGSPSTMSSHLQVQKAKEKHAGIIQSLYVTTSINIKLVGVGAVSSLRGMSLQ